MNARSMTFSAIKHYQTSSCSRDYLKGCSPKTHIKTAPNAAETSAIAQRHSERRGTDVTNDSAGTLAGKTGGAYDVNSLAHVGGGYEYRKYSMGTVTLLGINLRGDGKNTVRTYYRTGSCYRNILKSCRDKRHLKMVKKTTGARHA